MNCSLIYPNFLVIFVSVGRPALESADVSLGQLLAPRVEGFTAMYRLLAAHRDEVAFAGTEVRVRVACYRRLMSQLPSSRSLLLRVCQGELQIFTRTS